MNLSRNHYRKKSTRKFKWAEEKGRHVEIIKKKKLRDKIKHTFKNITNIKWEHLWVSDNEKK